MEKSTIQTQFQITPLKYKRYYITFKTIQNHPKPREFELINSIILISVYWNTVPNLFESDWYTKFYPWNLHVLICVRGSSRVGGRRIGGSVGEQAGGVDTSHCRGWGELCQGWLGAVLRGGCSRFFYCCFLGEFSALKETHINRIIQLFALHIGLPDSGSVLEQVISWAIYRR